MKKYLIPLIAGIFVIAACQTVVITDFEECAEAGFPIAESHPRQCIANGKVFVEEIDEEETEEATEDEATEENVATDSMTVEEETSDESESTSFQYDEESKTYFGQAIATGYATITETNEPFCTEDCATYDFVYFNILSTENESLHAYIEELQGNSFVGDNSVVIGCSESGMIRRMNVSDEHGMVEYTTVGTDAAAILESTEENPVTITLERFLYTSGSGAPACYSHFANVTLN